MLEDSTATITTETGDDLLLETLDGGDVTALLLQDTITLKLNSLDFTLIDPTPGSASLGATVVTTDPAWTGTVVSFQSFDPVDLRNGIAFVNVTASNANPLPTDTAPFDLSDVPTTAALDTYLLEDGSGPYELENGTDFAPGNYELEGALSYGYAGLSVQSTANSDPTGPPQTLGRCNVYQPGLRPGNVFALTSLNQGYSATPFQVTQVTVTWPGLAANPFYAIEFGDTPQTLAAWTQNAGAVVTPVSAPTVVPTGPVIYAKCFASHTIWPQGGGTVTIASQSFSVSAPAGGSLTVQLVGQIDCRAWAWDNYVGTPRRAVRGVISGGIYTGAWQELPAGTANSAGPRGRFDLTSQTGIALPDGTYTVSIQINSQEFNRIEVYSAYAQAAVTAA